MTASGPSGFSSEAELEQARQGVFEFFKNVPFNKLLGLELLEIEPGRARLAIQWREDLCQPAGIMHGGAIASLVDTAIAHAILLAAPNLESRGDGGRMVAIDLRLKYLRPVSEGRIFCDARVLRLGRKIVHASGTVTDSQGKDVALGDAIYMLIAKDQLRKRSE